MELELQNVCKSLGDKVVLNDISFAVESGQVFGLLGKNGAGKTTTIRIIMDLFSPDSGKVLLDGYEKWDKTRIGYLPEERGLYRDITVEDQVKYIGRLRGLKSKDIKQRLKQLLQELDAEQYRQSKIKTLSKGNQQKIQLIVTLIHDPDIIILDEPFSGLDPVNAQILKDKIVGLVKEGRMIVFSSHQMSYVETFCQHICILDKGNIVLNGDLKDIKRTYKRNRIMVVPENIDDIQKLNNMIMESNKIFSIEKIINKKDYLQVNIDDINDKDRLFAFLTGLNIPLSGISIIEPTLEDIFIERVGG